MSHGTDADARPGKVGQKGYTGNPGGRTKAFALLERELQEQFGPACIEVMAKMLDLATGKATGERVARDGSVVTVLLDADPAAMKLFLDRVLGPVSVKVEDATRLTDEALEARVCEVMGLEPGSLAKMREEARKVGAQ